MPVNVLISWWVGMNRGDRGDWGDVAGSLDNIHHCNLICFAHMLKKKKKKSDASKPFVSTRHVVRIDFASQYGCKQI